MTMEKFAADPHAVVNEMLDALGYEADELDGKKFGNFSLDQIHSQGGNEGGGEYAERVFSILHEGKPTSKLIRITGFYASYYGTEWEREYTFVVGKPITRTEYFPE